MNFPLLTTSCRIKQKYNVAPIYKSSLETTLAEMCSALFYHKVPLYDLWTWSSALPGTLCRQMSSRTTGKVLHSPFTFAKVCLAQPRFLFATFASQLQKVPYFCLERVGVQHLEQYILRPCLPHAARIKEWLLQSSMKCLVIYQLIGYFFSIFLASQHRLP